MDQPNLFLVESAEFGEVRKNGSGNPNDGFKSATEEKARRD